MANVAEIQNGQVINGINSSQLATHGTSSLTSSSTGSVMVAGTIAVTPIDAS